MTRKFKIASAGNTIVPAYLSLIAKGYSVNRIAVDEHEETWQAVKENNEFIAEDPLALLGVVAMFEARGPNWKAVDDEIDAFVTQFP